MLGGDFPKRRARCTTARSSAARFTGRPRLTRPRSCMRKESSFTRCPCCRTRGTDRGLRALGLGQCITCAFSMLELPSRHPSARTARTRPRADSRVPGQSGEEGFQIYVAPIIGTKITEVASVVARRPVLRGWSTSNGRGPTMKLPRRRFLHLAACAVTLPAGSHVARSQNYPARPVRIIVGFSAGGTTDIIARLIAQGLSERLSQQFIIENRPGASANLATEAVVRAPPDGYTLLAVVGTNAINATLYDKLSFNLNRDIAPVAGLTRSPLVLEVHPSVPAKTVPELVTYAKAHPGKITMASFGVGSTSHVAGELFKMMAGVDLLH